MSYELRRTSDSGTRGEWSDGDRSGVSDTLGEGVERRLDVLDRRSRRRRKGHVEVFKVVNRIGRVGDQLQEAVLAIGGQREEKQPVSASEVPSQALGHMRKKTYSAGSNLWMLKSSPILSMVDSMFCIIGMIVSRTAWRILSSPPIALTLSTVAWSVD
jgi:hypothetical protein